VSPINFEDTGGNGPALVFIHGFPLAGAMWKGQLEAVRGKCRAIAYDVRGFGKSPAGDGQYAFEAFVDDLLALLDQLKLEKAALCGMSMGGYVALRAVEKAPGRVSALMLCDTRSEADDNASKLRRAAAISMVQSKGPAALLDAFLPSIVASPAGLAEAKRISALNGSVGLCGSLLAMASRTDTTESLSKIAVPTLVVGGEKDALMPPEVARGLASRIPGARCEIIAGAGHLSNLDQPEQFNKLLLEFVSKLK
jgi:pimeloyl-ACP methyl ester carboxylesterase